ncbi:hypothetical protein D3C84_898380 [compost metagenome]
MIAVDQTGLRVEQVIHRIPECRLHVVQVLAIPRQLRETGKNGRSHEERITPPPILAARNRGFQHQIESFDGRFQRLRLIDQRVDI